MPGLVSRCGGGAGSGGGGGGIWARHRDVITFEQLQKFWSELPRRARQELLRIDKQTLFEQARKNLYCSRCNGLLLDGFSQIVMYGKSLQQEGGAGMHHSNRIGASETQNDEESDDVQEPSVHPWGGLAATRDGILTLLDCFMNAKSLKPLQNVFDSARARERERELLYPDACGGGGRGWISQGIANYGRGHGTRETCALHTARLSCDTLVDFWSALSDETRFSLLRMKEEDFIERLMYRFDSKRFCRDCRRNVIREFKELKELKRMRREPRCTSWFCVADTAFQYEVSEDMVQADWHQSFIDTAGTYHHFEWAIGTAEGKSDILDFEDVGMSGEVQVDGLDLGGLSACFITLRAWKLDGRCTELSVKAHALKGQPCVHRRLVVGDGFVTITKGESIRRFFEHAEEAEEEEDDDAMDKDGNEFDGDGSRPQKHAKSPELAREFLLDAATVIFKEQVEKAFREGTARQNAHSIFVCLALKLLEERVHVACKEIITLEKQSKLLEEEEKEKREEEERKERRRTKEREKKLRRKERIKGKERERERKQTESKSLHFGTNPSVNDSPASTNDESPNSLDSGDSVSDPGDSLPMSPDVTNEQSSNGCMDAQNMMGGLQHQCHVDQELNPRDGNGSFILEQSKASRRKLRFKKDSPLEQASKWYDKRRMIISNEGSLQHDEYGVHRPSRANAAKSNARSCNMKFNERFHCSNGRIRYDFHSCSCSQLVDYRKDVNHASTIRSGRDMKSANKKEFTLDMPRPLYRSSNGVIPKGKLVAGTPSLHTKQVWEPTDARKKSPRSNSDPDISLRASSKVDPSKEIIVENDEDKCQQQCNLLYPADSRCSSELSEDLGKVVALDGYQLHEDQSNQIHEDSRKSSTKVDLVTKSDCSSKDSSEEEVDSCPTISTFAVINGCDPIMSSSSSDNCSSCLSEGDSGSSSSSAQNAESSSTSDSEDASQQSDRRDVSTSNGNAYHFQDDSSDCKHKANEDGAFRSRSSSGLSAAGCIGESFPREEPVGAVQTSSNGGFEFDIAHRQQHMLPMHNQSMHVPIFSSPPMGYHDHGAVSWSAPPSNGFGPFPQHNHYVFPGPLGYGLTANRPSDFCMRFTSVQPHPVFNVQQQPLYQTTNRVIVASSKDQNQNSKVCGAEQVNGGGEAMVGANPPDRPFVNRQLSSKPSSVAQKVGAGNADKSSNETSSFSLFHFGGPLAGAAGFNVNPVSLKDNAGGLPPASPTIHGDLTCSKREIEIEEYSLFATNNGSRFSFF